MSTVTGRERVVFFGRFMMIGGRVSQKTLQYSEALFNPNQLGSSPSGICGHLRHLR